MRKNRGFTLAEVLVTLAVIGVVGALTIPALTQSYEKQSWISGFKVNYNILDNAASMIMADNNGVFPSGLSSQELYEKFEPYLNTVKKCEGQTPFGNCFASDYKFLDGSNFPGHIGSAVGMPTPNNSMILSNGASVLIEHGQWVGGIAFITLDINGKNGPNIAGKDLHGLAIQGDGNQLRPCEEAVFCVPENPEAECPSDLSSGHGLSCSVRILRGDYGEDY